jgi:hypothetical protein
MKAKKIFNQENAGKSERGMSPGGERTHTLENSHYREYCREKRISWEKNGRNPSCQRNKKGRISMYREKAC